MPESEFVGELLKLGTGKLRPIVANNLTGGAVTSKDLRHSGDHVRRPCRGQVAYFREPRMVIH